MVSALGSIFPRVSKRISCSSRKRPSFLTSCFPQSVVNVWLRYSSLKKYLVRFFFWQVLQFLLPSFRSEGRKSPPHVGQQRCSISNLPLLLNRWQDSSDTIISSLLWFLIRLIYFLCLNQ